MNTEPLDCPSCGYKPDIEIASFVYGEYFAKAHCEWCWISVYSIVFDNENDAFNDVVKKWNEKAETI